MGSYRYRSLIEGLYTSLYTLNSPPVVSFKTLDPKPYKSGSSDVGPWSVKGVEWW